MQKIEDMNSVKGQNRLLQKKYKQISAEASDLQRYVESAHGGNEEVRDQIAETSKEILKFKQKFQELRQSKKDAEV